MWTSRSAFLLALCCGVVMVARSPDAGPELTSPERKALEYLAREVPSWSKENRCFSCHNNGDAARALYEATSRPVPLRSVVTDEALADTTRWLSKPENWDHNGGEGPFSDKVLARVQFSSALAAAVKVGAVRDRSVVSMAAERLARDQSAEGFWPVEGNVHAVGSPASYGRALATLSARDALRAISPKAHAGNIAKAERWLLARPIDNVFDASVALLAASGTDNPETVSIRNRAMKILRAGQSREGGWGPFVTAPPEPFDTALAVLALSKLDPDDEIRERIKRARNDLIATQLADGSWPETTRPPGAESYAQRLSTTGWATLALLASTPPNE